MKYLSLIATAISLTFATAPLSHGMIVGLENGAAQDVAALSNPADHPYTGIISVMETPYCLQSSTGILIKGKYLLSARHSFVNDSGKFLSSPKKSTVGFRLPGGKYEEFKIAKVYEYAALQATKGPRHAQHIDDIALVELVKAAPGVTPVDYRAIHNSDIHAPVTLVGMGYSTFINKRASGASEHLYPNSCANYSPPTAVTVIATTELRSPTGLLMAPPSNTSSLPSKPASAPAIVAALCCLQMESLVAF